jgi:DNA-binding FrmR family transcriptional regulator
MRVRALRSTIRRKNSQRVNARPRDQRPLGELHAGIFRMLEEGADIIEIVVQLEVPYQMVEELYEVMQTPDLARRAALRKRERISRAAVRAAKKSIEAQRAHEREMSKEEPLAPPTVEVEVEDDEPQEVERA